MKKVICLFLCVFTVFCFNTAAFADVSVDYDMVSIPNDHSADVSIIVNYEGESDAVEYHESGLVVEWGDAYSDKSHYLNIGADANTNIGNSAVVLYGTTSQDVSGKKTIYVFVWDNSKPEIDNVTKSGKKVKLEWSGGKSKYYQVQYRVKNGSWKTVSKLCNSDRYYFNSLSKGKTYQFRVRPATPSYEWGTQYGKWSSTFTYKVR